MDIGESATQFANALNFVRDPMRTTDGSRSREQTITERLAANGVREFGPGYIPTIAKLEVADAYWRILSALSIRANLLRFEIAEPISQLNIVLRRLWMANETINRLYLDTPEIMRIDQTVLIRGSEDEDEIRAIIDSSRDEIIAETSSAL